MENKNNDKITKCEIVFGLVYFMFAVFGLYMSVMFAYYLIFIDKS